MIAVVGCGYWGSKLVRVFSSAGVLSHIVEPDIEVAESLSYEYAIPNSEFNTILANPEVKGVVISTPSPSHANLAIEALEAGKHIFVEKPLAMDLQDAEAVATLAREKGLTLMVGHLLQYHPVFQEMKRIIYEDGIGDLKYIYSNRLSFGRIRTEENVMWSFAPHDLSMILSLLGSEPEVVSAHGASFITPGIIDWSVINLRHEKGVFSHIHTSWLHPYKEHRFVVIGDNGMMVFDDTQEEWNRKLLHYQHSVRVVNGLPELDKAIPEYLAVDYTEPLKNECDHFIQCVLSDDSPHTDGDEAVSVIRILCEAEVKLNKCY